MGMEKISQSIDTTDWKNFSDGRKIGPAGTRYVPTMTQTSEGTSKTDTFTTIYIPEGMEETEENVHNFGFSHYLLEQSGCKATEAPKFYRKNGSEIL